MRGLKAGDARGYGKEARDPGTDHGRADKGDEALSNQKRSNACRQSAQDCSEMANIVQMQAPRAAKAKVR